MSPRQYRWRNGLELPIAPEPVSSPPFTYGLDPDSFSDAEDVFKMDGVAQATPRELRRLFSGRPEGKEPTNQWFATQLHLYGVPFKKSARKADLKEALRSAVAAGKCEDLAPSVAAVRDRLKRQYDEDFKRLEDKMFAEIKGGHAEEANADPPRFIAKYFLDAQGRPDREKTKVPLSFKSWNHEEELDEVIESVPGLAILKTWSTALVGWATTMEQGIEAEFARLETFFEGKGPGSIHSAQANVDLKLFLRKYLAINTDGSTIATASKPFAPVTLTRFRLQNQKLPEEIISKAPGLHMKEFYSQAVIGWDVAEVDAEIGRLEDFSRREEEKEKAEERARLENEEAEKKARWERRCKGHYDLLAKQQGRPNPVGVQTLAGSYLIKWHQNESDGYGDYSDPRHDGDVMKLNIFPPKSSHGVTASFLLGLVEGTMLLAMSKRDVEQLREEQPKHDPYSEWEHEDSDDDGTQNTNVLSKNTWTGEKRQLGDVADPYGVLAARAKRQKTNAPKQEPAHPNRVYFQFACNTVEAWPEVDDGNEHVGHLDFDRTGLAAKGVFYLPCYFRKTAQQIEIFKIADEPDSGKTPKPWCMFDGRSWAAPWSSWR